MIGLVLLLGGVLTEEEAVARALAHDPALAALRTSIRVAEAAPRGIGLMPNPQLRLGVTDIAAELGDPASKRNNVGLAWQPPRPGALKLETAQVRAREAEARSAMAVASARAAAEVRLSFRTLVLLDERLRLGREVVRLRQQVASAVREQIEAGLKTLTARQGADMALAEAQVTVEQVEHERRLQAVRLARRTNTDASTLEAVGSEGLLEFKPASWDRAALRRQALAQRTEPGAGDERCQAAEGDVTNARRELYPWFSSVQFFRRTGRVELPGSWGFQVGLEIPVFRWKENRVAAARAALSQCRDRRQATVAEIESEIDEVVSRLETVAQELAGQRPALMALASAQADEVDMMRAEGHADKVQPALARIRALDARRDYLDRLLEYRVLEAGLRQALGE